MNSDNSKKMSPSVQNSVNPNQIVPAAAKLQRNIRDWKRKNAIILEQNKDALNAYVNEPLNQNSSQDVFNKYKIFLKNFKKNKTKQKKNIKKFEKNNHSILEKHKNDTELKFNENISDDVFKEFKRLVKQWKYEDEFKNLLDRYPEFNYQMKRRKKLQPGEKRTRRKKYSKKIYHSESIIARIKKSNK